MAFLDGLLKRTFIAFRDAQFRRFWIGRLSSTGAFQVRKVVRGWLVYALTGSALSLGWVSMGWSAATLLFSLVGGVICDRLGKRDVLVGGQVLCAVVLLAMALLISTGAIKVWHFGVSSLLLGVLFSFTMPARLGLVGGMVPSHVLMNAMALSTLGLGIMGFLSSTLGGFLLENISAAAGYYAVALMYGGAALAWGGLPADKPPERQSGSGVSSIRCDLIAGARYIASEPTLLTLVGLELCQVIIFWPLGTLLPVFASDVFQVGALGLGVLNAIYAVGGLVGALFVAVMGDSRHKGAVLLVSGALCGICLILFARANAFYVALSYLLVVSMAASVYMAIRSTLLQSITVDDMRGRMASYLRLTWGFLPLGSIPVGALTDALGARWVATMQGVALISIYSVIALARPQLRRLGPSPDHRRSGTEM